MTLCISWIRKVGKKEELCMIADSCVSGGKRFWAAPKLFTLQRGDCAFACSGSTDYFYPIAEHIQNSVEINQPVKDRSYDFLEVIHYFVDIINKSLFEVQDTFEDAPDFNILLAGYSWEYKKFCIKEIKYNKFRNKFYANNVKTIKGNRVGVIGNEDVVMSVRKEIYDELDKNGVLNKGAIDMEPLKILMKYIGDENIDTIGGHPQMLKIYPFMRVLPWGFVQTDSAGSKIITYYGRPLLDYETFPYPMYDLNTGETKYMKETIAEFKRQNEHTKPLNAFKGI